MKNNSSIQRHCTHLRSETEENNRKWIATSNTNPMKFFWMTSSFNIKVVNLEKNP